MTVIPLVVALLVVGIAKSAEAAHAGRVCGWPLGALDRHHLYGVGRLRNADDPASDQSVPASAGDRRRASTALAGIETKTPQALGIAEFFKGVIPDNVFPPQPTATSCRLSSSQSCSR